MYIVDVDISTNLMTISFSKQITNTQLMECLNETNKKRKAFPSSYQVLINLSKNLKFIEESAGKIDLEIFSGKIIKLSKAVIFCPDECASTKTVADKVQALYKGCGVSACIVNSDIEAKKALKLLW